MGGAHPNHYTALETYDARTGKKLRLSELLSAEQMNSVVSQVKKALPNAKNVLGEGAGEIDSSTFVMDGDTAEVRKKVAENFALVTKPNGRVGLEVAWMSGIHAMGPAMIHFSFDAPNDAAFRKKIGLD